jgi:hypothetical protein
LQNTFVARNEWWWWGKMQNLLISEVWWLQILGGVGRTPSLLESSRVWTLEIGGRGRRWRLG